MKLQDFGGLMLFILPVLPWLLLLVEGVSLFLTGHVLTNIPWNEARVIVAVLVPFFIGAVISMFS